MIKLLQHSAVYTIVRAIPGVINFAAIPIYTRLLSPYDYGLYVLIVAIAGFGNVVLFDWIRQSLLRFLPNYLRRTQFLLSNVVYLFLICAGILCISGSVFLPLLLSPAPKPLLGLAVVLALAQAWFEMNLELARSLLKPLLFGGMMVTRAILSLSVGVALIYVYHMGAAAPLFGLTLSMIIAPILWMRPSWVGVVPCANREMIAEMLRYGLPLILSVLFAFLLGSSDRFLISFYLGVDAAGAYAASYDLVQQMVAFVTSSVGMAVYPLILRSTQQNSIETTSQLAEKSFSLLVAASLPFVIMLWILPSEISQVFLGSKFSSVAVHLFPWLAISMFLSGARAYYYDMAFYLSRRTASQAVVLAGAAAVNIVLNIWWLPRLGIVGAAYSTFIAFLVALLTSIAIGRRYIKLSICWLDMFKVGISLGISAMFCLLLKQMTVREGSLSLLVVELAAYILIYAFALVMLNAGNSRALLQSSLRARRSGQCCSAVSRFLQW